MFGNSTDIGYGNCAWVLNLVVLDVAGYGDVIGMIAKARVNVEAKFLRPTVTSYELQIEMFNVVHFYAIFTKTK